MSNDLKTYCFFILLFSTSLLHAQKFTYPNIKPSAKTLQDFISDDWIIKDSAHGDLNGDKLPDIAAIIEYKNTIKEFRPNGDLNEGAPRVLIIFLKNKIGSYNLFLQNNTFITRYGEGGMSNDAYGEITIGKGILEIIVQFTRGHCSYKFRMQNNELALIGATNNGVSGGKFYGLNVNFLTKKAKIEEGNIEDENLKVKWVNVTIKKLKLLKNLKMILSWQVVKGQYI